MTLFAALLLLSSMTTDAPAQGRFGNVEFDAGHVYVNGLTLSTGARGNPGSSAGIHVRGDAFDVSLGRVSGHFTSYRRGDLLEVSGEWGSVVHLGVAIRLTPTEMTVTWGTMTAQLKADPTVESAPGCTTFVRIHPFQFGRRSLEVCGAALQRPGAVEATVALLNSAFEPSQSSADYVMPVTKEPRLPMTPPCTTARGLRGGCMTSSEYDASLAAGRPVLGL